MKLRIFFEDHDIHIPLHFSLSFCCYQGTIILFNTRDTLISLGSCTIDVYSTPISSYVYYPHIRRDQLNRISKLSLRALNSEKSAGSYSDRFDCNRDNTQRTNTCSATYTYLSTKYLNILYTYRYSTFSVNPTEPPNTKYNNDTIQIR